MSNLAAQVTALPSSFRDPSGYVFRQDGTIYRRVTALGMPDYRLLMDSGLYSDLSSVGLLIPHEEVDSVDNLARAGSDSSDAPPLTLRPQQLEFVSYPYEWCFSQLKDAALTTLAIQKAAIAKDMWLKDASAYNIQFHQGQPVFIDTLSLEAFRDGSPWPAYKQFCQHFLAPLALMALVDIDLSQLLRVHLDGVPLPLASKLLPASSKLKPGLLVHIHLHAAAQRRFSEGQTAEAKAAQPRMTKHGLLGIIDGLEGAIHGLNYQPKGTVWGDYYANTNYTSAAMQQKLQLVGELFHSITPTPVSVWDLGANNGEFSRIASRDGIPTVAWDIDPAAVEQNYRMARDAKETSMLPLVQDLTNPSPGLGWAGQERESVAERGPVDAIFALALIHHLAITNNVPLPEIARYFATLCAGHLLIEWVPDTDSQVQRLLNQHDGPVYGYTQEGFESAFTEFFEIATKCTIPGTERTLYLLKKSAG